LEYIAQARLLNEDWLPGTDNFHYLCNLIDAALIVEEALYQEAANELRQMITNVSLIKTPLR